MFNKYLIIDIENNCIHVGGVPCAATFNMARPASRKQRRKEERQAKKVKNALHFSKKTASTGTEGCRGGARNAPNRVYKGSSDDIRSKRGPRNTVRKL